MTGNEVMRNAEGERVEIIGWDRKGKVVNERIVARWFALIADRINKPLAPDTVLEYIRLFDYARLSDRALDQALSRHFATVRGFWPSPSEIIEDAKKIERDLRPKLPSMNKADQDRHTHDAEYRNRVEQAAAWAKDKANESKLKEIKRRVNFDICRAYGVLHTDELSPIARDIRQAAVVEGIISAIHLRDLVQSTDPKDGWMKTTVLDTIRKSELQMAKDGLPVVTTLDPTDGAPLAESEPAKAVTATPEAGKTPYWVRFMKQPSGCVQARDEQDAMKLATELAGAVAVDAQVLPYPANPRLNQIATPDGFIMPSLCWQPEQCKGRQA